MVATRVQCVALEAIKLAMQQAFKLEKLPIPEYWRLKDEPDSSHDCHRDFSFEFFYKTPEISEAVAGNIGVSRATSDFKYHSQHGEWNSGAGRLFYEGIFEPFSFEFHLAEGKLRLAEKGKL